MDAIPQLHWLDLVVVITLFAGLALGAIAGFKRIVLRLLHYAAAVTLTIYLFGQVKTLVASEAGTSDSMLVDAATGAALFLAAYLLVLFCVWLAFRIFHELVGKPASEQVDKGIKAAGLKPLDRLLGAAFGTLLAAIPVTVLAVVLYCLPQSQAADGWNNSVTGPLATKAIEQTLEAIPPQRKQQLAASFESAKQRVLNNVSAKWKTVVDDVSKQLADQMNDRRTAANAEPNANTDDRVGQSDTGSSKPTPPLPFGDDDGFPVLPSPVP